MAPETRRVPLEAVRRLAVTKQHLAGKVAPKATPESLLSVVRDLGFVQWDPVSIVAPSHLLSFASRLREFRPEALEDLLWREKKLLEHWTPMASIVLTEDYPLYLSLMKRYPGSLSHSWGSQRTRAKRFLASHARLRRKILAELKRGPRTLGEFEDHARTKRDDGEWAPGSDVAHMLYHLTLSGDVMVVGHEGNQNVWGLPDGFLPDWVNRDALTEEEFERSAAQRAIRALGTATPREITLYFVRGRYEKLKQTLADLEQEGRIERVAVEGLGPRDERYVHASDVPLLGALGSDRFEPRMSLLPPFDTLLGNQSRGNLLFGFDYIREQFLPKEKRRYGLYVLPILWGARFIGRIDPRLDKETGTLVINSVHAEPGAPTDPAVASEIRATIARLASFVGARRVSYPSRVPAAWRSSLR